MTSRLHCFFDIKIDGNNAGRIVFELFNDICPRTCENFRCLCTGERDRVSTLNKKLYYKKCHFHRIVKDVMIQSGDLTKGNGTGSESIYGGTFNDETFQIKHDQAYLLSMDNQGPNTNGSQFFITTSKASHLDDKHVVFGRVISGQSVVDAIQNIPVDSNSRPLQVAVIAHCGQLILDSKSNEMSDRDIMVHINDDDDNNSNNETSHTSVSHYHSSKRIDSSGRLVKGRGFMKYTGKSRSRSRTPPHWHSAVKDRKLNPSSSPPPTVTNVQHQRKNPQLYRRRHSSSSTDDSRLRHYRRSKFPPSSFSRSRSPLPSINQSQSSHHGGFKAPLALPIVGNIYWFRQSVHEVFGLTSNESTDSSSFLLITNSSSRSSSSKKRNRAKHRPCLVRKITEEYIELFIITTFHKNNPSDPIVLEGLTRDYLLKRLIPISPETDFTETRQILVKRTPNSDFTKKGYLVLVPIRKPISTRYYGPSMGYIETDDLLYIQTKLEQANTYVDNDDDDDDDDDISFNQTGSSSIAISRSYKSPDINSNEKVKIWIKKFGGWCSGDAIASVEMFDPSSNEWRAVASMSKRRCEVGVGVLNNLLYAIGGHDSVSYLNSVERFDPQTNQWSNEIAPTSSCRASVGVGVLDGYLFVVGGHDGISCLNLVEKYDPSVQQWIRVASMGTKRLGVAVAILDGYLYAIGGSDGQCSLSTVERYDPKANKWSSVSSMNTQRKHLVCAVYNGYIYVVGGRDDATELSTAERFNPKINQWSPIVTMNSKRSEVRLAVVNNHLMAIDGFDGAIYLKSVELYDSESNSWRLHSGMNYRRLSAGVGVIRVQQYDLILYKSNSTSNIVSIPDEVTPVMIEITCIEMQEFYFYRLDTPRSSDVYLTRFPTNRIKHNLHFILHYQYTITYMLNTHIQLLFYFLLICSYINAFIPFPVVGDGAQTSDSITHTEITQAGFIRCLARFFYDTRLKRNKYKGNKIKEQEYFTKEHTIDDLYKLAYPKYNEAEVELHSLPLKFILDFVMTENALVDFNPNTKKLSPAHFDSEAFINGSRRILQLRKIVVNDARNIKKDLTNARESLGRLLHTLQDFYSHSNWIEMGNTNINNLIGVKENIGSVADRNQATCTKNGCTKIEKKCTLLQQATFRTCPLIYYDCKNNILPEINNKKLLTSGYLFNQSNENHDPLSKPTTVEKCSHGGVIDDSSNVPAFGGINKDSNTLILSPHSNFHFKAVDLAIKATEQFFNNLRKDVGNKNFDRLFAINPTQAQHRDASNAVQNGTRFRVFTSFHSCSLKQDDSLLTDLKNWITKRIKMMKSILNDLFSDKKNLSLPTYNLSDLNVNVKDVNNVRAAPYLIEHSKIGRKKRFIDVLRNRQ
ncbi:unnamed protein product [Rotaria sordida]|uniref:peptidylprolyl isomerase n=1 Tax=Rotaria sordida TaxID=392033 RepID=A0A814Z0Q9_9BILA|nr:unnamed protein product [Rotaria sordida]CAF1520714.1 unnamed protein product [Rotaria sordida]